MIGDGDQRSFHRMAINAELMLSFNQQRFVGVCKDLSATGMGIHVEGLLLNVGDEIGVALSGTGISPLTGTAKVVRVGGGGNYALEFIALA